MKNKLTKQDLIDFEDDVAKEFNDGNIKAPVHLYSGNEEPMLEIFERVESNDWVFCTWRSHYQCLLKGVPKDELKQAIMDGNSISLCFSKHRVFSSAIVTGIIPMALGVAMDIKRSGGKEKVWCFVGDMTAESGSFYECSKYATTFDLPIEFIVEDNDKSVCTDTKKTWNIPESTWQGSTSKVTYYKYITKYPHAGAGQRVQF